MTAISEKHRLNFNVFFSFDSGFFCPLHEISSNFLSPTKTFFVHANIAVAKIPLLSATPHSSPTSTPIFFTHNNGCGFVQLTFYPQPD
jgi:hypothetical protein